VSEAPVAEQAAEAAEAPPVPERATEMSDLEVGPTSEPTVAEQAAEVAKAPPVPERATEISDLEVGPTSEPTVTGQAAGATEAPVTGQAAEAAEVPVAGQAGAAAAATEAPVAETAVPEAAASAVSAPPAVEQAAPRVPEPEPVKLTFADLVPCERKIATHVGIRDAGCPADPFLLQAVRGSWQARIFPKLESELEMRLREQAEEEAINVFGRNLEDLLLAAPAGPRPTMGLDPGLRTGVKVAVVEATGRLVVTTTIYPHEPKKQWDQSIETLKDLVQTYSVDLIAIGNGTASRETDRLVSELLSKYPELKATKVIVSEAGASVYSASEFAALEFPNLDVSLRGAVSIARRLQDPLAELVKIEPKSIGVGQYQHDVSQSHLARVLDAVVEDCVNAVGVDVNTASVPLLSRVSGLNRGLAESMVSYRNENGAFKSRVDFRNVPRFGEKTFEQAAGFLRIVGGENPLDASAVHPEAYPVVEKIIQATGKDIKQLVGDSLFLRELVPAHFTDEQFGEPTVRDILSELEKPGRDPRPEFKTAAFKEGVNEVSDLQPGMELEGVVTNVTNFGAFVDVGVHQDGLVHVSQLANRFVKDPRTVVKAGDIVKVKVLEVDEKRKRISLSMRTAPPPSERPRDRRPRRPRAEGKQAAGPRPPRPPRPPMPAGPADRAAEGQKPPESASDRPSTPERRFRPEPRGDRRPQQGDRRPQQGDRRPQQGDRRPQHGDRRPEQEGQRSARGAAPKKPPEKPKPQAAPQTTMAAAFAKLGWFPEGQADQKKAKEEKREPGE